MKELLKTGPRTVHLIYARPAQPTHPDYLVVFATGTAEAAERVKAARSQTRKGDRGLPTSTARAIDTLTFAR